jgi:hypothetical protein
VGARSERALRSGLTVRLFSARPGAAVQRCAASDAAPWPDVVAAEPDGMPGRQAAPLPEAAQGERWRVVRRVVRDEPSRAAALVAAAAPVGPLVRAARPFDPGRTRRHSPRSRRRQVEMLRVEMLQSDG